MLNRYLNAGFILLGISSGLIGNYSSSTPNKSKLLPPDFAFSIWAVIYITGLYLVLNLIRKTEPASKYGISLISIGYFFSGLWIRFDGHSNIVAVLAILTLMSNVSGIYFLKDSSISKLFLNLLATFSGWITVATALVIADASGVSTANYELVATYLAISLVVSFGIYLSLNPLFGYIGTISWATFSLLFVKSSLGTPGFYVSLIAFLITLVLIGMRLRNKRVFRANF